MNKIELLNIENADSLHDEKYLLALADNSYKENNFLEAGKYLQRLIREFEPKPEYFSALAIVWKKIGNKAEAEKNYLQAIELNGNLWEAYYNLGILYHEQNKIEKAIGFYKQSITIKPGFYLSHYNLGNAYRETFRLDDAIICYKKTIDLRPDFSEAHYNIGVLNELLNKFEEALGYYNQAIHYNSEHVNAHWNKSLLLLSGGNLAEGFEEYEWRMKRSEFVKRDFSCPALTDQNIFNKNILVYCEQGLGDTIQFVRYLPMLKAKGCKVTLECNKLLFDLLKSIDGIDEIILFEESSIRNLNIDYNISLLSLPYYFRTNMDNIPAKIPYITAPDYKKKEWFEKLKSSNVLKIGLVWGGNPDHGKDDKRSIPLNAFYNLSAMDGIKLFSLQKGKPLDQIKDSDLQIENLSEKGQNNFVDTTAVIQNLDLVISVDTSVAHLAGAMGKHVWTLLPYYSDWRWLLERTDSPWYPTMRLYRQKSHGNWENVISQVAADLKKIINQKILINGTR